jgi:hypothetical protein
VLLILEVDPVPTWFFVFAWYPLLVVANHTTARVGSRGPLFDSIPKTLSLFGWSAVIWLVFEALNFRLRNWYYVFLPASSAERWAGILLSFGTVIPAIMLAERLLESAGVARGARTAPLRWTPLQLRLAQLLGMGMAVLALAFPRTFFPLIWGATLLIADPIVMRRYPESSLFNDLASGSWGRIIRLMLGGLVIGLVWEFLNFWARGKWIYTVPWLEQTKLFEMPPLGFLGFPFFALEAWAMYHVVARHRPTSPAVASDRRSGETGGNRAEGRQGGRAADGPWRRMTTALVAVGFATLVLLGMERWTISSITPHLGNMPGVSAVTVSALDAAGVSSPFVLARSDVDSLARTGAPREAVWRAVETARLVTLRGIGALHATRLAMLDVRTVCQLARQHPGTLWRTYHHAPRARNARLPGRVRPTPAEVRVWIGAARRACTARFRVPARH